jgi:hypothetical protein
VLAVALATDVKMLGADPVSVVFTLLTNKAIGPLYRKQVVVTSNFRLGNCMENINISAR